MFFRLLVLQTACDSLYNVLLFPEGGWLVDSAYEDQDGDFTGDSGPDDNENMRVESPEPNRVHQLSVLRSIYIPQVRSQWKIEECI